MKINGVERRINREEALCLHREMWEDMRKELGDNPTPRQRFEFKCTWLDVRGYSGVECACFLCEYAGFNGAIMKCNKCPIDWTTLASDKNDELLGTCCASYYTGTPAMPIHKFAPISEILALPERSEQT
jgi:hypothetical protein